MKQNVCMRRSIIIVLFVLFTSLAYSQYVYWEEPFMPPPAEWSLDSNWFFNDGVLFLNYSPPIPNYDLSAVSPVISLPDNVGDIIVNQCIIDFTAVNEIMTIGVIVNDTPHELWQHDSSGGGWGSWEGSDIVLPLSEFAGEDVQIQFRSYGASTWNINWCIFNVMITGFFDNDMAATEIAGPTFIEQNQQGTWSVTVKNSGLLAQNDYTVKLFKHSGLEIGSIQSDILLQTYETASFDFTWTPYEIENTGLYGQVILAEDEFPDNDISNYHYLRVNSGIQLNVIVWNNDANSHFYHPETGAYLGCEESIKENLDLNGIEYTVVNTLPEDLSAYDIVFVELGLWCVG